MRKSSAKKIAQQPDPKYKDPMVERFVNNLMDSGKKSVAYKACYEALDLVEKNAKENGYELWKKALQNIMPGMKWMKKYAQERKGRSMAEKLAAEIIAASKNEGGAVKKKEDVHKMAEANKAFSHFRVS